MPHFIIKPDPDVDFYLDWSTIVDCPTFWGSRAELEAFSFVETAPERFDRADATGTSAIGGFFGGFDDNEFLVREIGPEPFIVKRSDMKAFCESLDPQNPNVFDKSLTTPWVEED
jgi:hypothetical protein